MAVAALVAALLAFGCGPEERAALEGAPQGAGQPAREAPEPSAPDRFRPGFDARTDALPPPRRGGRVVVHIEALPKHLNYLIENTGVTRRIQQEVHATLLARDLHSGRMEPVLAESYTVEDTLVLSGGRRVYGALEELPQAWRVVPRSAPKHALAAPLEVPKAEVARIERGTVFTFVLRPGVRWHDGHPLRVEDFLFSWRLTKIPEVECDEKRFEYDHLTLAEKLDERTLRFFYDRQYFGASAVFEALIPLPAHLYDLRDPEHPQHDPGASDAELAAHVNTHPQNRAWIGLGPYRVTAMTDEYVEAERFDGWFDPAHGGWFDAIRWRFIADDALAFRALQAGEIDFSSRLLADDYFAAVNDATFGERCYTGYFYTPRMSFVGWNLARPKLADVRVRTALAHACDWDEYVRSFYRGLAERVTAEWYDGGPDYDRALQPLAFDLQRAAELLNEAGWYDRDGDGWVDRDGAPLEIELLMQAGSKASEVFTQRYQETLARVGVKLAVQGLAWPAMNARVQQRDFDAELKVWIMPIESDPMQRWHSSLVGPGTANETSFADPQVDRLIESYGLELDPERRGAISRELQRRLYAAQAFMYGVKVPHKFGIARRIRNLRLSPIDPGYRVRDWYIGE